MRSRAPALVLLALLALPLAGAQQQTNPIQGDYQDIYMVQGRVVDANGLPAADADVVVTIHQAGVNAKPTLVKAECSGYFIAFFQGLRRVDPDGKVDIEVRARGESPALLMTRALDPFFRRTDASLQTKGPWNALCDREAGIWPGRISVAGRILNRTEPYEEDGVEYHARPYHGYARLRFWDEGGLAHCPPSASIPGHCDPVVVDERGDFRYSFTFAGEVPARGTVEVTIDDRSWNATVDPTMRLAVHHIEMSGQGAPKQATPTLALPLLAVALVAAALLVGRSRGR